MMTTLLDVRKKLDTSFQGESLAGANLQAFGKIVPQNFSLPALDIQQQYDEQILPVITRVQDLREQLTALGKTEMAADMERAFNGWNEALKRSVFSMASLKNEFKNLADVGKLFKELQMNTMIERITSRITTLQQKPAMGLTEERFGQKGPDAMTKLLGVDVTTLVGRTLETDMRRTGGNAGTAFGTSFSESVRTETEKTQKHLDDLQKSLMPIGALPSTKMQISSKAEEYKSLIESASKKEGVDPELITRIIQRE